MSTAAHAGGRAELNISRSTFGFTLGLAAMLMLVANSGVRAQQSTQDLAAAAQNPVAAMRWAVRAQLQFLFPR